MKSPEEIRNTPNLLITHTAEDGGYGEVFVAGKRYGSVIWSNGGGWEHVSVAPYNRRITPSWDDMCRLKDMFFREDETVVQFHPAKSEYVNNVGNCLHLWRPIDENMPTPPSILVGIKDGQSREEIKKAISEVEKVTTVCYGDETVWESRKKAEAYFLELMSSSEGSERDRYTTIYLKLKSGITVCTDEEEQV